MIFRAKFLDFLLCGFVVLTFGCGDDDGGSDVDATVGDASADASADATQDASEPDAGQDAQTSDAAIDADVVDAMADASVADAASTTVFVTGDVDGVTKVATTGFEAAAAPAGKLQFTGWTGGAPGSDTWTVQAPNSVGSYECDNTGGSPFVQWATVSPIKFYDSDRASTSCAMEVTQEAAQVGDFIEGTFTATLENISVEGETVTVTNGSFRVRRAS